MIVNLVIIKRCKLTLGISYQNARLIFIKSQITHTYRTLEAVLQLKAIIDKISHC